MEETEQLRDYAETRSDAAFEKLARRYVNLVYSSALRQVRDAATAEDVTQATFLVLARKAHRLPRDVPLSSWLLAVTRYAAKDAIKSESRRKHHEKRAAAMKPTTTDLRGGRGEIEADWAGVAPLLDEAVASLKPGGRSAIILRYFERKSYRQVAEEMRISEVTARQRVSRALEQLRGYFSGKGITLSTVSLKAMIAAHAVCAAPAAVGAAAASMGGAGQAVLSARHAALAHAATIGMIPIAAKLAAVAAIIVVVGAGSLLVYDLSRPHFTVTLGLAGASTASFRGSVVTGDAKPVEGAEVFLAQGSAPVAAYGPQRDGILSVRTAADGSFELPKRADATAIVVRADQGYAQLRVDELGNAGTRIALTPWAQIEGTVRVGGKLRSDETVELFRTGATADDWERWHVMHETRTKTDLIGRFVFSRVIGTPKEDTHASGIRWAPSGRPDEARSYTVRVEPGSTAHVMLGGDGATVGGRVSTADKRVPPFHGVLTPVIDPQQSTTRPVTGFTPVAAVQPISFTASANGVFQVEDVPPGDYQLQLRSWMQWPGSTVREEAASVQARVTVPRSTGRSEAAIDVGTIQAHVNQLLLPGDQVPDFSAMGTDEAGGELNFSRLRGKTVLLYVEDPRTQPGAMSSSLKPIFDRFGADPRLAILEVSRDSPVEGHRPDRDFKALPWHVVNRRPNPSTRPAGSALVAANEFRLYDMSPQRLFLINGDGRLLSKCQGAADAYAAIDRALTGPMPPTSSLRVEVERVTAAGADRARPFQKLANPTDVGNLARDAIFSIVDGVIGRYSGGLDVLHDGLMPDGNDQPMANFSFDWGTLEGRIGLDLGRSAAIGRINTYSWHKGDRGPQLYTVYGSNGLSAEFNASPKIGTDPRRCGWTRIADVDSRPGTRPAGGRYAVSISNGAGPLGTYRYLLFAAFVTETDDDWGHTFFSEIDVLRQPEANP